VLTAYAAAAFIFLQVCDIIFPALNLPPWSMTVVVVLLGIGLLLVFVLTWIYDITDQGIVKTDSMDLSQPPKLVQLFTNRVLVSMIMVALVLSISGWTFKLGFDYRKHAVSKLINSKSIAVLPFTNMSTSEENAWFTDGIHDDILTQLSKIGDLKVISRTSVMQFRNTTKTIKEIGLQLGVANILEGSVRVAGDRVRVVAQLINTEEDSHVWAETYDRKLIDKFEIQDDISFQIAAALEATLSSAEEAYLNEKYTSDIQAWDLYTRGNICFNDPECSLDTALSLWEQSAERDSAFLLPYIKLTTYHAYSYFGGIGRDPNPSRLLMAKTALDRAEIIDPKHPEVYLARGYLHYYGSRAYKKALNEFNIALERLPNNSDLLSAISFVKRRQGKLVESQEYLSRACTQDPMSIKNVSTAFENAKMLRRSEEAERYYQWYISLLPEGPRRSYEQLEYLLWEKGDVQGVRQAMSLLPNSIDTSTANFTWVRFHIALADRDFQKAIQIAEPLKDYVRTGICYLLLGESDNSLAHFDSARIHYEKSIAQNPLNPFNHWWLGAAMAGLGQYEQALLSVQRAEELFATQDDFHIAAAQLYLKVVILQLCKMDDEALDLLEFLMTNPGYINQTLLKVEPWLDGLKDHPRYHQIMERGATVF
jgi:TolB-like protein/Tfp pilus assembly protein PilF